MSEDEKSAAPGVVGRKEDRERMMAFGMAIADLIAEYGDLSAAMVQGVLISNAVSVGVFAYMAQEANDE